MAAFVALPLETMTALETSTALERIAAFEGATPKARHEED
jgi:hypothetical protein